MKNREILFQLLKDMEDYAKFKQIKPKPIYILGGSGCIMAEYLERATVDIDILDIDYSASSGKLFRLLENYDFLDLYFTTIAKGFDKRAQKLEKFSYLDIYILSKEDIITSKLGRYSQKDKEDISNLMKDVNRGLVLELIDDIIKEREISPRLKENFIRNVEQFKESFYV